MIKFYKEGSLCLLDKLPGNIRVWTRKDCEACSVAPIVEVTLPLTDGDRVFYMKNCSMHTEQMIRRFYETDGGQGIADVIKNVYECMKKEVN